VAALVVTVAILSSDMSLLITFLGLILVGKETNRGRSTSPAGRSSRSGDDLCWYG